MPPTPQETEEESLSPVAHFPTLPEAHEHTIVILAMGLDCLIQSDALGHTLYANPADKQIIQEELALYTAEQTDVSTQPALTIYSSGIELAILWSLLLFFIFTLQSNDSSLSESYRNSSIEVIGAGEYYRPFTALFLHADFQHLLSNVAYGIPLCLFVASSLGPTLGWILILLSGTLGNALNAYLHFPESFLSLGASTATFGALGILVGVGIEVAWRSHSYRKLNNSLLPLVAGLVIFSWTGIGGPEIDIAGHLYGFTAGLLLGLPASRFRTS